MARPDGLHPDGGEDYELAFAMDGEHAGKAIEAFGSEFRTGLSVVGEFTAEWTGVRINGEPLDETGHDHFLASTPT